jgi:hypothetical protein
VYVVVISFEILPSPSMHSSSTFIPVTTVESRCDFFQHDISGKFLQRTGRYSYKTVVAYESQSTIVSHKTH